jgi:probable metal-binding protein
MNQSIHGHQVMEMVEVSDRAYTKQTLESEMLAQFGNKARFHTCMDSDMTAAQLIDFFMSKGKFVESNEIISLSTQHSC